MLRLIAGAILFLVITTGCQDNGMQTARQLIDEYDYKAALTILESEESENPGDKQVIQLRGEALLVEGRTEEGLDLLTENVDNNQEMRTANARTILSAVQVIIRETSRAEEAAMLLDTCLNMDPGLMEECSRLAWNRAVEYLKEATDAGYYITKFLEERNPKMMSRLRSGYGEAALKYDEIAAVKALLNTLQLKSDRYIQSHGKPPSDIAGLEQSPAGMKPGYLRTGWYFYILPDSENTIMIIAETLHNNPAELPKGMRIIVSSGIQHQ